MRSDLLLLEEVAAITRVPLSTVRHWVATGKLPSVRPGRRRLVHESDLCALLDASAHPAGHRVLLPLTHQGPEAATSGPLTVITPLFTGANDCDQSTPYPLPQPPASGRDDPEPGGK